MTALPRQIQ